MEQNSDMILVITLFIFYVFLFNGEHIKIVKTNPKLYCVDDDITFGGDKLKWIYNGERKKSMKMALKI